MAFSVAKCQLSHQPTQPSSSEATSKTKEKNKLKFKDYCYHAYQPREKQNNHKVKKCGIRPSSKRGTGSLNAWHHTEMSCLRHTSENKAMKIQPGFSVKNASCNQIPMGKFSQFPKSFLTTFPGNLNPPCENTILPPEQLGKKGIEINNNSMLQSKGQLGMGEKHNQGQGQPQKPLGFTNANLHTTSDTTPSTPPEVMSESALNYYRYLNAAKMNLTLQLQIFEQQTTLVRGFLTPEQLAEEALINHNTLGQMPPLPTAATSLSSSFDQNMPSPELDDYSVPVGFPMDFNITSNFLDRGTSLNTPEIQDTSVSSFDFSLPNLPLPTPLPLQPCELPISNPLNTAASSKDRRNSIVSTASTVVSSPTTPFAHEYKFAQQGSTSIPPFVETGSYSLDGSLGWSPYSTQGYASTPSLYDEILETDLDHFAFDNCNVNVNEGLINNLS